MISENKIHLVCSAGGVKCFSYIGAIRRFYQDKIKIESISACSMGTMLGALIASGIDLKELEERILKFNFSILKTKKFLGEFKALLNYPFASHELPDYEEIMKELIGDDIPLAKLKIPFAALALDIRQNRFLVYSSESHPEMKISELVKIATAVPFMYPPYKLEKRLLVDASVATESPVWMAVNRNGNYPIIVLKVNKEMTDSTTTNFGGYIGNLIGVAAESHDYFIASQISRVIDIPINCGKMSAYDFNIKQAQIENLILQGEKAAEQTMKEYNFNFNNILHFNKTLNIQEVGNQLANNILQEKSDDKYAELNAQKMINSFNDEVTNRHQVFVSYSHLDKIWLDKLNPYLSAMERFSGIKAWSDKEILAGELWNNVIDEGLASSKVALLLVSKNYLASEFIIEKELSYFLKINESQKIPIVWIAVSSSLFKETPLKDFQCANNPEIPLDTLSDAEQNIQLTNICNKVIELIKSR